MCVTELAKRWRQPVCPSTGVALTACSSVDRWPSSKSRVASKFWSSLARVFLFRRRRYTSLLLSRSPRWRTTATCWSSWSGNRGIGSYLCRRCSRRFRVWLADGRRWGARMWRCSDGGSFTLSGYTTTRFSRTCRSTALSFASKILKNKSPCTSSRWQPPTCFSSCRSRSQSSMRKIG